MAFLEDIGVRIGVNEFFVNLIISVLVLILGIILGRILHIVLRKSLENARIEKARGYTFIKRFIIVIEWSIYILFLDLSLRILGIPKFIRGISSILVIIPALVGGLLLLVMGFAIANYLKESIEESQLKDRQTLAKMFYFFVLYVFMAFALKTALISFDKMISNIILVILTAIVAAVVAYKEARFSVAGKNSK